MLFYSKIYLLNQYLLSIYYMFNPGVVAVNKTDEIHILMNVCVLHKGAMV